MTHPLNLHVCVRTLSDSMCVFERERPALPRPPECSWMSHPICSLSPRRKWTLHPLVRWLISAPLPPSSPPHLAFTPYTQLQKAVTHTHILIVRTLSLAVCSRWRSMRKTDVLFSTLIKWWAVCVWCDEVTIRAERKSLVYRNGSGQWESVLIPYVGELDGAETPLVASEMFWEAVLPC